MTISNFEREAFNVSTRFQYSFIEGKPTEFPIKKSSLLLLILFFGITKMRCQHVSKQKKIDLCIRPQPRAQNQDQKMPADALSSYQLFANNLTFDRHKLKMYEVVALFGKKMSDFMKQHFCVFVSCQETFEEALCFYLVLMCTALSIIFQTRDL